jgi:iron complex outermembrane receptor protein
MGKAKTVAPRQTRVIKGLVVLACLGTGARAEAVETDLTQLSIEDLMQVKVVSATKVEQTLQDTAAAVFVITAEDIRRSGATVIPEVLRLAPGVEVARIDASRWSVTIRGFAGTYSNKLLVLVDGRSIYTPLFSGVNWEVEGPPLDEIEQIEIVRGPGGSLWGANAVNGVINIITKHTKDTQGGMVTLTAGNKERAIASVRYADQLGEQARYRLYGQFAERDSLVTPAGRDAQDNWRQGKGGFRLDWNPAAMDSFTVQGEFYNADLKQNFTVFNLAAPYSTHLLSPVEASGGSVQARWQRQYSAQSKMELQAYYHYESHQDYLYDATLDTVNLDFQHNFPLGDRQEIVWGLGYRRNQDEFTDTVITAINPRSVATELFSAFVQDQVDLITNRFRLIAGAKLEHNDFTGWEWQPSLRALWTPHPNHRLWAAASRAVRTPSRGERDVMRLNLTTVSPSALTGNLPGLLYFAGSPHLGSEELTAYEIGYRGHLTERFSLDATVFYHDYAQLLIGNLGTVTVAGTPWPSYLLLPVTLTNAGSGVKSGFELAADWRPAERWRWRLAYSYLDSELKRDDDSSPIYTDGDRQQISLLASWNARDNVDVDVWWRYVAANEISLVSYSGRIESSSYPELGVRLGWRPRKDVELSVVGNNLLGAHHLEFVSEAFAFPVEVERSVYGQVKWKF